MQIWIRKSANGRPRLRLDYPLETISCGHDGLGGPWLSVAGIGTDFIEYRVRLSAQDLHRLIAAADRYHLDRKDFTP